MTTAPEPAYSPEPRPLPLPVIARAAARLLDDAAGLPAPSFIYIPGYGPATASLHLPGDSPTIREDMQAWADRYGSSIDTTPAVSVPGSTYATAAFTLDGITYEISAIIPGPDPDPAGPSREDRA